MAVYSRTRPGSSPGLSSAAQIEEEPERSSQPGVAQEWSQHATPLAAFTNQNLVNRRDAFGHYIAVDQRKDLDRTAFTDKTPLTLAILQRHFEGRSTGDLIGLHSTALDEPEAADEVACCSSRWIAWDIDRHDDSIDPETTFKAALKLRDRLIALGFAVLLFDSNGNGGYHLVVIFDAPVATEKMHAFGKWLLRDWRELGLDEEPEVFPKQASIAAGAYGNWLRLPGRHHTRDHWTRVWSGEGWLEGSRAIKAIISSKRSSAELIPAEALAPPKPPVKSKGRSKAGDYEKDVALAAEALGYLDPSMPYREWLEVGMALTQLGRDGLTLWDDWSSGSEKYSEGVCDRKWRSFTKTGVRLGTLFAKAKQKGFGFLKSEPRRNGKAHKLDSTTPPPIDPPIIVEPTEPPEKPSIEVNTLRQEVVDKSIAALGSDPDLYRRGFTLVTVVQETRQSVRLTGRTEMKNTAGSPRIDDLSEAVIGCRLSKFADYFLWKKDRNGESIAVPAHPPDWCIRAVATYKHWPNIRPLAAVAECPYPRSDGSIVEAAGYDPETETLYLPAIDFPEVPKRPTRDDAREAWARIALFFRHFPYATEDDRVVVLAGLLTVIARPAILGAVPGIVVNGNKPSTGKGKLIDGMSIPGIGRTAPTSNYPDDPIEAGKVKVAIALSGSPVVHFDNKDAGSFYGNSALDSALTAKTIDDRILGTSKRTGEIPLRTCWFLSGNNVSPGADAYRRWLVCNLVTELEHPELRSDIKNELPFEELIRENRGEIVRDALTILRAHTLANRLNDGWAQMGSFEEWDRIIRGAVWFATGRDCLASQRKIAEESPDRLAKIALLEGWRELPEGKAGKGAGVTSTEALALVDANPERYPTLHGVLLQKGKAGKLPSSASLGNILRGLKNSLTGGYRLTETCKKHGAACWVVESTHPVQTNGKSPGPAGYAFADSLVDQDDGESHLWEENL